MHTANTNYIYKNDLDKGYFKRNIAYDKYEDLKKEQNQIKFSEIKLLNCKQPKI